MKPIKKPKSYYIINLVYNLEWYYCNENFEYYQTFFYEEWVSTKIKKIVET